LRALHGVLLRSFPAYSPALREKSRDETFVEVAGMAISEGEGQAAERFQDFGDYEEFSVERCASNFEKSCFPPFRRYPIPIYLGFVGCRARY